jgi:hypothetical protein
MSNFRKFLKVGRNEKKTGKKPGKKWKEWEKTIDFQHTHTHTHKKY